MRFPREFYIPKASTKIADKSSSAVAYIYQGKNDKPCAALFGGKRAKPDYRYQFRNDEQREKFVADYFQSERDKIARKAEYKAERQAKGRGLEVGDILKSVWGYDQTNVDYYEVTKLVGKTQVEIRKIASASVESDAYMTGKCTPLPGKYIGEPMRKVAKDGRVRLTSYSGASKIEPKMVSGVKTYGSDNWTAYA